MKNSIFAYLIVSQVLIWQCNEIEHMSNIRYAQLQI